MKFIKVRRQRDLRYVRTWGGGGQNAHLSYTLKNQTLFAPLVVSLLCRLKDSLKGQQSSWISSEAVDPENISILIGGNAVAAHLYSDCRVGGEEEPIALKTRFGWTLFGQSVGQ